MTRLLSFTVAIVLGLVIGIGAVGAASLRTGISVTSDVVTLGDLFDDAGRGADVVVASAPLPGASLVLRAPEIQRFARRHGVVWRRPVGVLHIRVSRAGRRISAEEILSAIEHSLPQRGFSGAVGVEVSGYLPALYAADSEASVDVVGLDLAQDRHRFTARLAVNGNSAARREIQVSGQIVVMKEVPVLSRAVSVGSVISDADVGFRSLASRSLDAGVVITADALVGKTPKRPIRTGEPVRSRDIERPKLVKKGDLVTLTYRAPRIVITTVGRAVESGAEGDTVRIQNQRSRSMVEGIVTAPGNVEIGARRQVAAAQQER